jgi:molybdopterin/thiamine biosynthesis adenylyltransferase
MFRHVLVAGLGTLGSEVVKNLGLLGCESVFVADADTIEDKNVSRCLLLREAAVGQSKVLHALDRLATWFPKTQWSGKPLEIADVEPDRFLQAEVLFSCVDTDLARTEIAALAARYRIPVCDAGLGGITTHVGRVSWFPGDAAACFACLLTSKRRAALLSMWESDVHACWADEQDDRKRWASTATMASIVGGLQVEIALSAAAKETKKSFSIHLDLSQSPVSQTIRHSRSADCPFHDEVPGALFPICTLAECSACNRLFSPNRRIAWVRRWGACPFCGSHNILIRDSLHDELTGSVS